MESSPRNWSSEENLREGERLKSEGNISFGKGDWVAALRAYHKALLHLQGIIDKQSPMAAYSSQVAT